MLLQPAPLLHILNIVRIEKYRPADFELCFGKLKQNSVKREADSPKSGSVYRGPAYSENEASR
jgi:hypothetical protein